MMCVLMKTFELLGKIWSAPNQVPRAVKSIWKRGKIEWIKTVQIESRTFDLHGLAFFPIFAAVTLD